MINTKILTTLLFGALILASSFSQANQTQDFLVNYAIAGLHISSGCLRPDLSTSTIEGKVTLNIAFSETGEPIAYTLKESNATEEENKKVSGALMKCTYNKSLGDVKLPKGTTKEFTYRWQPNKKLKGIAYCIINYQYPAASLRLSEEGLAVVSYRVSEDKKTYEVKISQSSGFERLDAASQKMIESCLSNDELRNKFETSEWLDLKSNWKLDHPQESPSSSSTEQKKE